MVQLADGRSQAASRLPTTKNDNAPIPNPQSLKSINHHALTLPTLAYLRAGER
jgi:hypothetical protein